MLKILAIGDPHFKTNNVEHTEQFCQSIINLIKNNNDIDFVVLLGDIHDKHQYIHSDVLTRVSKFCNDISKLKPLYILVGNHDRINNSEFLTDTHPFVDMIGKENIYIAYKVLDINIKNHRFLFVPYVPNGRFMEALNTVKNPLNCSVIFAHQEFKGVPMKAVKSINGDDWDINNPWVITGHIHDYWFNNINIIYPGTPMQHSFGDKNDKTVSMIILYDDKVKDNLYKLEENRIDLGLKKREIIRLPYNKISSFIPNPLRYQKLIIIGTISQINTIKSTPIFIELKTKIEKIDFDYVDDESEILTIINDNTNLIQTNTNYLSCLYDKIKENPIKLKHYNLIFN